MEQVYRIEFHGESKEEQLPGISHTFPCISSCAHIDRFAGRMVPWHWHNEVELFYMQSGMLEYSTPKRKALFPAGSGGMINSNVLHMTKGLATHEKNVQLEHIFNPLFISGQQGSIIEQQYVKPLINASHIELLSLSPDNPQHTELLNKIKTSFDLSKSDMGYAIKLRSALSDIWLGLLELASPLLAATDTHDKTSEKLKLMIIYVQEHYDEKFSISDLASAAFISERECFRAFHDCLCTTPVEYITSYRLKIACSLLERTQDSITGIGHACGLGSSSYFGKVFRDCVGCTPLEYRRSWQNIAK